MQNRKYLLFHNPVLLTVAFFVFGKLNVLCTDGFYSKKLVKEGPVDPSVQLNGGYGLSSLVCIVDAVRKRKRQRMRP